MYTQEELKKIIENHQHWLKEDCEGWETMRADLRSADLRSADLRSADLRCADLSYANLSSANLSYADLRSADLRCANLSSADLSSADLSYANLSYANLSYANLSSADLSYANLSSADLSSADLSYAKYNEKTSYLALQCPEKGSFIGFKKVNGYIVELEIPAEAKRSSATTRKCRCEFAKVLSITNKDGSDSGLTTVHNDNYCGCDYVVGEIVRADEWDEDRWNECSHGIHFFITREEAVNY